MGRLGALVWCACLLGPSVGPRAAAAASIPERLSVLLITVDTLRVDHVSLTGGGRETTPNIDAFFDAGEVYLRAYSAEANTGPSIVSILTGLYPSRHGVRLLYQKIGEEIPTLADYLGRHGYQTAAIVSNVVLTRDAVGLDRRFDFYDDFLQERTNREGVFERRADATTDAALGWLERHRDDARPHLLWVHYIDPHGPYDPPPGHSKDFSHDVPVPLGHGHIQAYQRIEGVDDALEYRDRYDEEIAFMDEHVGRLLRAYDELGLTESSVVIFTADHGETMTEHRRYFTHGYHVWEPIMRVPLAIRRPGAHAARSAIPVSLVDVVPSLLDDLGIEIPERLDGRPLGRAAPGLPILVEASGEGIRQRALIVGDKKWFASVDPDGKIRDRWTLQLANLPERREGASWEPSAAGDHLLALIESEQAGGASPKGGSSAPERAAPNVAGGRSPKQLQALRALGYVE